MDDNNQPMPADVAIDVDSEPDEFDYLEFLLSERKQVPAERGWNVVFVGKCGCGSVSLRYEPVVAWVIDVLGPLPVVHGGVLPEYSFMRRPDGTFTTQEERAWLTEEEVLEIIGNAEEEDDPEKVE